MASDAAALIQKVTGLANVLRDDGVSNGDYVEQVTYLLFLKMADEQAALGLPVSIPAGYDWRGLLRGPDGTPRDGADLEEHYRATLQELARQPGLIGVVYRKAQNRLQNPARLRRVVDLIDSITWMALDFDVKGEIYEGLLQKYAEDTKSGAGQYFTPRPLIRAIVDVMRPEPGETVCDPACGTGGFFLAARDYVARGYPLDADEKRALRHDTFRGVEIVDGTARLCVMNLLLHGVGGPVGEGGLEASPIEVKDGLAAHPGTYYDLVLSNPPFGKKSTVTITTEDGGSDRETYERTDFTATTSNKQLNFVQHIKSILKVHGRAAVVVPDNVLFEGGAGEEVRRALLRDCDVHTLLRLPTGIFYAQGVKANVLFFEKRPAAEAPWTRTLWVYDLRTNSHFTLKTNPLRDEDLADFVRCYNAENRHERAETERFRPFDYDALVARDKVSLDVFWLRDDALGHLDDLPEPDVLAAEIADNLEAALDLFRAVADELAPAPAEA